jgi:hypothetical protein
MVLYLKFQQLLLLHVLQTRAAGMGKKKRPVSHSNERKRGAKPKMKQMHTGGQVGIRKVDSIVEHRCFVVLLMQTLCRVLMLAGEF